MDSILHDTKAACSRETVEFTLYSLAEFSALWCGVNADDVQTILENAHPVGENNTKNMTLLISEDYPCLNPKMRILMDAITNKELVACDEYGCERDNIAWRRVHISGKRGRDWLKIYCKVNHDELPRVFFPELEREIPLADSLRAENERLKAALEAERTRGDSLATELEKARQEAAQGQKNASDGINTRREHSYQLLIAGLLQEAVNHGKEGVQWGNIKTVTGYVDSVGGNLKEDAVGVILKESVAFAASTAKKNPN